MPLTYEQLIDISVNKYFIGLNEHDVKRATDIMALSLIHI